MLGIATGLFTSTSTLLPQAVQAQEGKAVEGQIGLQASVTPIMDSIAVFHDGLLMWIISGIVLFVTVLLLYIMIRYNARANPTPSKTTHNVPLEIAWTVVPIVILIVIAVPSFGVLADQQTIPDGNRKYLGANIFSFGEVEMPAPELTIKATGVQWNWEYDYVDYDGADFSSFMLSDAERLAQKPDEPRLLATDFDLVVPVDTTVRVQVTATDVIHAFAVPSFGIKIDAVPGRLNETWFNSRKTGMFYGQCSELCGKDHAFMPISVRVVSKEEFATWIEAVQANGVAQAASVLSPIS
ncbi:MAG TPA: cytochrome c oxidase subunit II [Devosia sp.]|nr:cytochrome c oxidase subunit II [Devosia sp.]